MTSEHRFPFWVILFVLLTTACQAAPITPLPLVTNSPTRTVVIPTPPPALTVAALVVTPESSPTIPNEVRSEATPSVTRGISAEAATYLENALDILQQHSVRRNNVDWTRLRASAHARADTAQVPADTYDAIRYAVEQLGDQHSRFYTPEREAQLKQIKVTDNSPPRAKMLDQHLAYLFLPGFVTFDDAQRHLYANQLYALIQKTESSKPCAWVLDLRQNAGGNIWPMLAGIGPLLGDGMAGAFVYPDGQKQTWQLAAGHALLDETVMESVDTSMSPHWTSRLIAILTGPKTQSAGEAVAIAFRGRANARSFGQPTGGLSTANATYELKDGAAIVLTVVTDADRTGKVYGGRVSPDEVVTDAGDQDATMQAARAWLTNQPACANKN